MGFSAEAPGTGSLGWRANTLGQRVNSSPQMVWGVAGDKVLYEAYSLSVSSGNFFKKTLKGWQLTGSCP